MFVFGVPVKLEERTFPWHNMSFPRMDVEFVAKPKANISQPQIEPRPSPQPAHIQF